LDYIHGCDLREEGIKTPSPLVFNIQRFSLHDGPGIRTTVFFKGCPLRCPWCHNPESQRYEEEWMADSSGSREIVGRFYSLDALTRELEKDRVFFEQSGGGVTLSGGEVMAQDIAYVEALAKELAGRGIPLVIDTCGDVPYERFRRVLPYTERFLYDLKFLDEALHKSYTGQSNQRILENLRQLSNDAARIDLRLILLDGINAERSQMDEIIQWLCRHNVRIEGVHLLPFHEYGRGKYGRLGRKERGSFAAPSGEKLECLRQIWTDAGYPTVIGGEWH